MSDITKKILDTIKGKNIKPKPRWHFILRRILIWFFTVTSVIIGSLAFSAMIFRIVNNDWEVIRFLQRSPLQHALNTLPYIWIILLALFVVLAYYNARHTKGAYKYQAYWFLVGSIVVSLVIGGIFYAFGIGPRVHMMAQQLPFFQQLIPDREEIWLTPENGLLAGEITDMLSGVGIFAIEDFNGNYWIVRPAPNYIPPPPQFVLEPGVQIRMLGQAIEVELFEAERVMPYHIGPGMLKGKMPDFRRNGGPKNFPFGR